MILPQEIEKIVFTRSLRGYKDEEVDKFLEEVAASLAQVMAERDALRKQVSDLKVKSPAFAAEKAREAEQQAAEIIKHAKKVAEEIIASALMQSQNLTDEQKVKVPGDSGNPDL